MHLPIEIIQEDSEDDDDDSSLPEDEEAELLTENVNSKFFKTMAMLRLKDPSIYQKDQKFFDGKRELFEDLFELSGDDISCLGCCIDLLTLK